MANKLTKKQKAFADNYLESGNATEATIEAGYDVKNEHVAAEIGSQNLRKLDIREYLQEKSTDAVSMIYKLSQQAENEAVRLNANKDILDRSGYKPIERSDITSNGKTLTDILVGIKKKNESGSDSTS